MKRSKLLKLLIPLTLGMLFFSFTSTIQAAPNTITFRPITHWIQNNPRVSYGWGGYLLGNDEVIVAVRLSMTYPPWPDPDTYDGYIKERVLMNGSAELTVYIERIDAPFWVLILQQGSPSYYLLEEGARMNCKETYKFILPEPDMEIPNLLNLIFGPNKLIEMSIEGTGSGIFLPNNIGFTPGATAKIIVVQRYLNFMPPIHPEYPDDSGIWPVELINIQELPY